jgi:hypothetical protein
MARKRIAEIRTTRAPCSFDAGKMSGPMVSSHTGETLFDTSHVSVAAAAAATFGILGQPCRPGWPSKRRAAVPSGQQPFGSWLAPPGGNSHRTGSGGWQPDHRVIGGDGLIARGVDGTIPITDNIIFTIELDGNAIQHSLTGFDRLK